MPTDNTLADAVTAAEIVADELADIAIDDPERAAQFVSAVTPVAPRPGLRAFAEGSVTERAVPAAIVGVFLLQVLPKGRAPRMGLAVLGSALVAGWSPASAGSSTEPAGRRINVFRRGSPALQPMMGWRPAEGNPWTRTAITS